MEELYDIIDESGKLLGFSKPKSQVHKDGDWHISSHVWIINDKKELLIQKRSANKTGYPNFWDASVGGHVSAGEDPLTSAIREIGEEVGVFNIKAEDLKFLFNTKDADINSNPYFKERAYHYIYLLKLDLPIEKYKTDPNELAEVKYIFYKDLQRELKDSPQNFVPHAEYELLFKYLEENL